ncbi:chromosome segregation in meiosis-related protein [Vermiconidia calcicola]|uniref:Chromosome segregation in meiosis-related protein n=1 Tax=Vermiconidia calcicola TaxID=1690605 RepID=A0ACC3MIM7_9PEZI|nr:chromosome segregation in meiosis-related protein [Vermiconidia calcicola]
MPSAAAPNPRVGSAGPDDLDRLFNYDDAVQDFLTDIPLNNDQENTNNPTAQDSSKNIDEEVVIRKKRKPVPKLDENLLLSQAGIPKLRKITKSRLKFRGKGHEFSDMSTLLNMYQLWLDDLYPRAKFRDALRMVEKLGHSKRMQVTRRTWLDETKPRAREPSPDRVGDVEMSGALPDSGAGAETQGSAGGGEDAISGDAVQPETNKAATTTEQEPDDAPDDDELEALLAESAPSGPTLRTQPPQKRGPFEEDDSDGDDLDALLSEQPGADSNGTASSREKQHDREPQGREAVNDFGDEEEAMVGVTHNRDLESVLVYYPYMKPIVGCASEAFFLGNKKLDITSGWLEVVSWTIEVMGLGTGGMTFEVLIKLAPMHSVSQYRIQ